MTTEETTNPNIYQCDVCENSFASASALASHRRKKHQALLTDVTTLTAIEEQLEIETLDDSHNSGTANDTTILEQQTAQSGIELAASRTTIAKSKKRSKRKKIQIAIPVVEKPTKRKYLRRLKIAKRAHKKKEGTKVGDNYGEIHFCWNCGQNLRNPS